MRFTLFGVRVYLPIPLLATFPVMALFGIRDLFVPAFCLFAHELGHLAAAAWMKAPIGEMRVMPFGAQMTFLNEPDQAAELTVALAGPCASLLLSAVLGGLLYALGSAVVPALAGFLRRALHQSARIAALNLLPALPLDGGRILRAVLGRVCPRSAANKAALCAGLAAGAALLVFSLWEWPAIKSTWLFMGLFLLAGALREWKKPPLSAVADAMRHSDAVQRRSHMRLSTVAMPKDALAREALSALHGASLIAVMDGEMRLCGTLAEGDLLNGMVRLGADVRLGELLKRPAVLQKVL